MVSQMITIGLITIPDMAHPKFEKVLVLSIEKMKVRLLLFTKPYMLLSSNLECLLHATRSTNAKVTISPAPLETFK